MTDRAETVAGLAEVLAGQVIACVGECTCDDAYTGRNLIDPQCEWHSLGEDFAGETAAVVLAHLEAQGWARGREEWGVMHHGYGNAYSIQPAKDRAEAEAEALRLYDNGYTPPTPARRRVSEWEPVEDTDG